MLSLRATEEEHGNLAAKQEIATSLRFLQCHESKCVCHRIAGPPLPRFGVALPPASFFFPGDRYII
jgi:hypothetical protein